MLQHITGGAWTWGASGMLINHPRGTAQPVCGLYSAAPIWFTATSEVIIFQKHAQIMSSQRLQLEVLTSKLRQRAWLIHPIAPATY